MSIITFVDDLLINFEELTHNGQRLADMEAKAYNFHLGRKKESNGLKVEFLSIEQKKKLTRNLLDQSMREHIRSGIHACLAMIHYLEEYEIGFTEEEQKLCMIAYVLHDMHKLTATKAMNSSEYHIKLEEITLLSTRLCERLGVEPPPAEFIRVAAVSSYSNKRGDYSALSGEYRWSYLADWVHLMDQIASITGVAEFQNSTTLNGLKKKLQLVLPPRLAESMRLEYHALQEVRGVITSQLHNGLALFMKQHGFFPWLRFGDGTLYFSLRPHELPQKEVLIEDLVKVFFQSVGDSADNVDMERLLDRSTFRSQTLAFMLYQKAEDFARLFHAIFLKPSAKSKVFPADKFNEKGLALYGCEDLDGLYTRLGVDALLEEDIREKWSYTARYLAALQRLVQRTLGQKSSDALLSIADYVGVEAEDILERVPETLQTNSRRYDEAIWLSYRYLMIARVNGKSVAQVPAEDWREEVRNMAARFLEGKVTPEIALSIVDQELKIAQDLSLYFQEQLTLSWERQRILNELSEKEWQKAKTRSQKSICNICNRAISPGVEKKVKGSIIQDEVNVFSNRLLPKKNNVSALHWCGICSFEYILRQVYGLVAPGDKKNSRRLYLFAVPAHQFSDEVMAEMKHDLGHMFGSIHVHHRGRLKHAWQEPYVSAEESKMRAHIREHFELHSEYFQTELAERERLPSTGELLRTSPLGNVITFFFDCYSHSIERTRDEAWMKGMTVALSLHKLYGFRMLVTEKPFLTLSDIRELRYAIQLDSPPFKVGQLLPAMVDRMTTDFVIPIDYVDDMLHKLAYVWEVNQAVHPYDYLKPTDKHVSSILQQLEVHPIAGSYYFKRLMSDGASVSESVLRSCKALDKIYGGVEMELAKKIAMASVTLFEPSSRISGRAHRYENLFRLVVKGIKEASTLSELKGMVMKRLERLVGQNAGRVKLPVDPEDVKHFVELVYEGFYQDRCGGNLAKLNQKQNRLADGIFFETHLLVRKNQTDEEPPTEKEQLQEV
ncbi:type I-D CRISPR-associated protein Cas10d/Csc3 [Marininema halotolerans]|uniref:CRISPR type I-D/CYANO-associated protein Csc3/Cas10d n=1 Tax=Marininema halotolerans TaxID=1155944 RepID=A0A1I6SDM9_9BACL|nr:type I-D CRISPR-associated protein Cas10d/Csc3 [Marininema halotolerans]SFS75062.1 CRISPR type I-D/CYANO-associated protein Csc3/Cas10d [Marininema halotolerans]